MHATNSSHPANGNIIIPASAIFALKDLILELEDRAQYGSLQVLATLQALDAVQLNYMHVQRKKSLADKANFAALRKLPEFTVPKLMAENDEVFTTAFCCVVGSTIGINGIPIDYDMRGVTGNYDSPWTNQEEKLNNGLLHTEDSFKNDNITLYSFYYHYIGTKGVGYNIINKYHSTKNDSKCHQDFELHFLNDAYLNNKATAAKSTMNSAFYNGDCRNFTLDTYYTVMSKAFNYFFAAGSSHALIYTKKIKSFEQGLKDPQEIHWYIILKERWDNFPFGE